MVDEKINEHLKEKDFFLWRLFDFNLREKTNNKREFTAAVDHCSNY
jgi:hypothetical protein